MSLCSQCPIESKKCKIKCTTESEQSEKIIEAEALWSECNQAYNAMCKQQEIIAKIEEEYETNAIYTSSSWWNI